MIVPVMAISNLVLTWQIYSEETNGAHAHYHEPVPLIRIARCLWPLLFEAFQGVGATGDMAWKIGNSPLRKHWQSIFYVVKATSVHFAILAVSAAK